MIVYIIPFITAYILMLQRNRYASLADSLSSDTSLYELRKFDNRCIFILVTMIFLISALRATSIGADTSTYAYWFNNAQRTGLADPGTGYRSIEKGYVTFQYLISFLTDNFQVFLGIVAFIVAFVTGRFVKKYSVNPACTLLFFMIFFFQFYAITGLRQTISAMILMLSYDFVVKRKVIPFLIFVIIAYSFHTSAIIFVPFYFLANKKITKTYIGMMLAAFVLFFVFRDRIMHLFANSFVSITGNDHYAQYAYTSFETLKYTILIIVLLIIALFYKDEILNTYPNARHYFNGALISLVLSPMSNIRAMLSYWIFIILLYPCCFEKANERGSLGNVVVRYILPLIISVLMLISYSGNDSIVPYMFFWS